MTPDSDTYDHILLNGLLWYVVFFGIPLTVLAARGAWRRFTAWRDAEWPDAGMDEDWRVESSNVVPLQRVSR